MLSLNEFEKWLRSIQASVSGAGYSELETRESAVLATQSKRDAQFQEICKAVSVTERSLKALRSQKLPWWKFWGGFDLAKRISELESRLGNFADAKRVKYSELERANSELKEIEDLKAAYSGLPEIWRKREATFSRYAQQEYAALKGIHWVNSFWIFNGALVVETKPLICTGVDTDGSHLAHLLGVLRVSFLPRKDPAVHNMTKVVSYAQDTWDAPHHPRRQGSCWEDYGAFGLGVAQGNIGDVVTSVISALRSAKPLTPHETWGVPVLKLFPEAALDAIEIEF